MSSRVSMRSSESNFSGNHGARMQYELKRLPGKAHTGIQWDLKPVITKSKRP